MILWTFSMLMTRCSSYKLNLLWWTLWFKWAMVGFEALSGKFTMPKVKLLLLIYVVRKVNSYIIYKVFRLQTVLFNTLVYQEKTKQKWLEAVVRTNLWWERSWKSMPLCKGWVDRGLSCAFWKDFLPCLKLKHRKVWKSGWENQVPRERFLDPYAYGT